MFLELIATFIAGLAVAGVIMLANRLLGGRLPRWLIPVGAGLGMIGTTIASEYGWFDRTRATLPEGMVIAQTVENRSFYRPWTYAAPYVERFVAVDTTSIRTNDAVSGQKLADLFFFGRWSPVESMPVIADCPGARRAPLTPETEFDAAGAVIDAPWIRVTEEDPVLRTICEAA
ncbi:hypothetical protein [Thalassococcus sp. S3]|uniref:hypothetical protein n=1 Tax=Thalassococcus sp. S3 TaxID=2017482 RepID=UPI0010246F09|nr:hypothetical protein [Thalassococcus sp. S3]QBF32384.1 hypothetical protein CFI11_14345 [Thalassococcus sp. S3]